jgi:hypothetical protein
MGEFRALAYASRSYRPQDRSMERARKIQLRLGGSAWLRRKLRWSRMALYRKIAKYGVSKAASEASSLTGM